MSFWDVFVMLCIWVPVAAIYAVMLPDIMRRDDLTGGYKVMWMLVVLLLPVIGSIVYLMKRPTGALARLGMEHPVAAVERHLTR